VTTVVDPIAVLVAEHRRIEQVLDALEHFSALVFAGRDHRELGDFVRFCRGYTDGSHHGKEEDILFAVIVEEGLFPSDMGPVTVMLDEHEQGRRAVAELAELADKTALTDADRRHLVHVASGYAGLLRHHIAKEDGVLFPLVTARLAAHALGEVERQFARSIAANAASDAALVELAATLVRIGRST
jgi:hemerythrin-like domain-containing protein